MPKIGTVEPRTPADVDGQGIVPPEPFDQFRDDIGQAEGQEKLLDMAEFMDPPQEKALDQSADDKQNHRTDQQGQPELSRGMHHDGIGKIGAQHVHGRMGEVQNVHHAEDQRESRGNEKKKPGIGQSVEKEDGNITHVSTPLFRLPSRTRVSPLHWAGVLLQPPLTPPDDFVDDLKQYGIPLLDDLLDLLRRPVVKTPSGFDAGCAFGNQPVQNGRRFWG